VSKDAGNSTGNRVVGRPFKPGASGNPRGRPKGFGKRIRELTQDGEELIDIALKVARGELTVSTPVGKDADMIDLEPTARERMDAVKWLADRGWGRAPEVEDDAPVEDDEESVDVKGAKAILEVARRNGLGDH
jgi:hypothetical protein